MSKLKEWLKKVFGKLWKWEILAFCLVILGFLVYCGLYVAHWELRPQVLEIYFFQLDKGRSIFIRTPHNKTILIDGGQNTQVLRELTRVTPFYRRRIDTVIVTSSVAKNAGGLAEVVDRYEIGKVIESSIMGTSTAITALEKSMRVKKLEIEKVKKGDSFDIDGVNFKVLFPDLDFQFTKSNLPELVISLSYGSTSAIFLGDVSKNIQKTLIQGVGRVDLVEYAHSAGDSRTSGELFDKLSPHFAIITKQLRASAPSTPKKQPKKPHFDIMKKEGVKVINLVEKGTVEMASGGDEFRVYK